VNMFDFNTACRGEAGYHSFIAAIWAHEGMGSGTDNGHEAQARIAARDEAYDPHFVSESIISQDLEFLHSRIRMAVYDLDSNLMNRSASHVNVRDNWCGSAWVWSSNQLRYLFIPVLNSDDSGSTTASKCHVKNEISHVHHSGSDLEREFRCSGGWTVYAERCSSIYS
jgi:hypothetical protein